MLKNLIDLVNTCPEYKKEAVIIAQRIEQEALNYARLYETSFSEGVEYALTLPETWRDYEYLI